MHMHKAYQVLANIFIAYLIYLEIIVLVINTSWIGNPPSIFILSTVYTDLTCSEHSYISRVN